ncbi:MAG: LLM class flavin-dependent oxidoreductase, partial [Candidatus Heimdallarchaeota archaeon]|nr:LLM class flavin-dependent oxidoreductase [Candidatus Heimdallarchaeota archaeon]
LKLSVYVHGSSPFNPKTSVEEYIKLAKKYENDGFDTLWFADHLIRTPDPQASPLYETWSLISGLSMVTSKIRFGTMVTPITFRDFGLFMKMISTIDHLSNGRITVGLGNGWYVKEHSIFGMRFRTTGERMTHLREHLEAMIELWSVVPGEKITRQGQFINLNEAYLNPKPLQDPHPPILIGGGGEKQTLKYVAKYAQMSNFGGTIESITHKLEVLEQHCENEGTDFDLITPTTNMAVIIGNTREDVDKGITNYRTRFGQLGMNVPSLEDFDKIRLVGTKSEIQERIDELKSVGLKMINLVINDKETESNISQLMN